MNRRVDRRTAWSRRVSRRGGCRRCGQSLPANALGFAHCFPCRVVRSQQARARYGAARGARLAEIRRESGLYRLARLVRAFTEQARGA